MGASAFSVLTEFKFDVAQAVVGSQILRKSVDQVTEAVDNALDAFKQLSNGMIGALGLGAGGIVGILDKAVKQSDAFHSSVLDFTSLISNNMQYLQGSVGSFSDRLGVAKMIMKGIADEASRLNLDQGELFNLVSAVSPELMKNGAAGKNLSGAVGISSKALSAAPGMGISAADVGTQLKAILGGTGDANGGLMSRLMATQSFKGSTTDTFNSEDFKTRLKMVNEGLTEIGGDMGDLAERSNLLSTQIKKLKNTLLGDEHGFGSIFKPVGDAIRPLFVGIFKDMNATLGIVL